jgi:hypothetical protein
MRFWTLEDLHTLQLSTVRVFLSETNRNFRREALRTLTTIAPPVSEALPILTEFSTDKDPEVPRGSIASNDSLRRNEQRSARSARDKHPALARRTDRQEPS